MSNYEPKFIQFNEIDSTNNYLKEHYKDLENFTIIQTDYQTKGRGQFERHWQSNKGENLLCSLLIKETEGFPLNDINPIVVSALISTLRDLGIKAYFKDPNDIYVDGKKIAGILIETKYDHCSLKYLIIGIGLNVNQTEFNHLNATSIKSYLDKEIPLDLVLEKIINYIKNNILLLNLVKGDTNEY